MQNDEKLERVCVNSKRYYVGTVRVRNGNKREEDLRKGQQRLFESLRAQGITLKEGVLMCNDSKYHEKGVDVKIAVDLLIGAYKDLYDTAIVISSDTDLVPAIRHIKFMGKNVEYIGFAHKPSFGLQKVSNLSRLLIEDELKPFIGKPPIK